MNPGLLVKLRPSGPWRIGPDSGARNRVDVVYHSDSLYSAVTSAMARLGWLEEWLDATARPGTSAVSFGSCFPFVDDLEFIIPPRTVWPPVSQSARAARVRWKSARFVPVTVVQSILAGKRLDENQWTVDGPSDCLVPSGRPGPFRTSVRWSAGVDRLTGATDRHSIACLEFRPGAGLWTVVSFADDAAREQWSDRVKAAFRLLADSGFGGERSRGWGRSEAPEFTDGTLPDLILPLAKQTAPAEPSPAEAEPETSAEPEAEPEVRSASIRERSAIEPMAGLTGSEPSGEEPAVEASAEKPAEAGQPKPLAETPPETASDAQPEPVAEAPAETAPEAQPEPVAETPAETAPEAQPEPVAEVPAAAAAKTQPEPVAETPAEAAPAPQPEPVAETPAAAAPKAQPEPVAEAPAETAPEPVAETPAEAALETQPVAGAAPEAAPEARSEPVAETPAEVAPEAQPERLAETPAAAAHEAQPEPVAETPVAAAPEAQPEPVAETPAEAALETQPVAEAPAEVAPEAQPEAVAETPAEAAPEAQPEPVAETPAQAPEPATPPPAPASPTHPHWLLSVFTPAATDTVDWRRGNYTVLARGGRVDSPAGSGELKKQIQMVAEGSVVYAESAPRGSAADVAPDGFAHPVFRAGFAVAIPLPEVS